MSRIEIFLPLTGLAVYGEGVNLVPHESHCHHSPYTMPIAPLSSMRTILLWAQFSLLVISLLWLMVPFLRVVR